MAAFVLNDSLMKVTAGNLELFQALFLRGLVATTLLAGLAWWQGQLLPKVDRKQRGILALRLIGEVGATVCFLNALFNMPLANATAILQSLPLAVTLGAAVFLKEPVGWRRWSAIGVGFIGILIIVRPGSEGFNAYSLSAIGSVGFVVLRDLVTRRLAAQVPSTFVALLTSVAITVLGGMVAPLGEWQPVTVDMMLVLCGAAGFLVFGYLFSVMTMRVGDIAFVSPFRYTAMIWAIILQIAIFAEYPDHWTLVGSAVVILMGIYTFYRERVRARQG